MNRILIVDDEPIVKAAFRSMLDWEKEGFEIVGTAVNGKEALEKIEEYEPDIVITDLKMPLMNGIELIEELTEKEYDGKIIVVSNFGEYELVREALTKGALDYMLKITMKREELLKQLHHAMELLEKERKKTGDFRREKSKGSMNFEKVKGIMLKEFLEHGSGLVKELEGTYRTWPIYVTYVTIQKDERGLQINLEQLQNIIVELVGEQLCIDTIPIEEEAILLVFSYEAVQEKYGDISALLKNLMNMLKTYIKKEMTISYSELIENYEEMREQYWRCREALEIKFYQESNLIESKKVRFIKKSLLYNYINIAQEIIELNRGNEQKHNGWNYFMEEARLNLWEPMILKELSCNIIEYIYISEKEPGENLYEELNQIKEDLRNCKSYGEFKELFEELCIEHIQKESLLKFEEFRPEVQQTILYIREQVANKITLKMIAQQINLNESYLCRIFKQEVGKSINTFITEIKMKKASELMSDRRKYIKEICQEVGIENQFYFNKVFKKYFGMTPKEYKNKVAHKKII